MKITRVRAPNPGMFTGSGTNAWLVEADGEVVIIDSGPDIEEHLEGIREAIGELKPVAVLVTHCHLDHVQSANKMAADLGVPCMGSCPGPAFKPDRVLADGDEVEVGAVTIEVIGTPGHTPHHLCYRAEDALFTGDHIMGGTSVIVEHMSDYLDSLRKIQGVGLTMLYPGHGSPMEDPDEVIEWYLDHRLERERQIIEAIEDGAPTVGGIVEACYLEVDPILYPLAARSVGAHVRKLAEEGMIDLPLGSSDWLSPVVFPAVADEVEEVDEVEKL